MTKYHSHEGVRDVKGNLRKHRVMQRHTAPMTRLFHEQAIEFSKIWERLGYLEEKINDNVVKK